MWQKIRNRAMYARLNFSKAMLTAAKMKDIRGHLIYINDLGPDSVVIDLGANEANFSKEMHALCGCRCIAIEPNVHLFEQINEEYISKFNYAITASDGPVEFYISNNKEASSIIKDFEDRWGTKEKQIIEGLSFATMKSKLNLGKAIEVLKIDIEGAELDLIESLNSSDVQNVKQISIEFHDWLDKALHEKTVKAIKKLVSLGFDAYTSAPAHDWPVEMLFLNRDLVQLQPKSKFFLSIFRNVTFLKY